MRTQQRLRTGAALALILAVPALAHAQYTFTTIDVPGAIRTSVNRNTTNALAGEFDTLDEYDDIYTHGFVLDKGGFTTIDVPITTINAQGQIAGRYNDATGRTRGFVGTPSGD